MTDLTGATNDTHDQMPIKALTLGNFKAFGPSQRIPLRPLTIVFGPNSSGKSSIVHGLLLAHEALTGQKANSLDVHRPALAGDSVDLGGFQQFVFRRDREAPVEWGCELDVSCMPEGTRGMLAGASTISFSVTVQWHRFAIPKVQAISVSEFAKSFGLGAAEVIEAIGELKLATRKADDSTQIDGEAQARLREHFSYKYFIKDVCSDMEKFIALDVPERTKKIEVLVQSADERFKTNEIDELAGIETVLDSDRLAVQGPRVSGYEIMVDGATLLKASLKGSGLAWRMGVDVLDTDHPAMLALFQALVLTPAGGDAPDASLVMAIKEAVDSLVPSLELERGRFIPVGLTAQSLDRLKAFRFADDARPARADDVEQAVRLFLPNSLQRLVRDVSVAAADRIRQMRYLGPLRSYPPRHLAFEEREDGSWHAGGGFAWDVVRKDASIRERVNRWLGAEFMKTPYTLKLQFLYDIDDLEASFDEVSKEARSDERLSFFEQYCASIDEDFKEIIRQVDIENPYVNIASWYVPDTDFELARKGKWPRPEGVTDFDRLVDVAKQKAEPILDLWLIDKRTETKVSHRDVGIGISQVLPVLVSAFAHKNSILAMEQPELHLHPALQAELADVFIESAINGQNTFLLETHSEHLLLRVMRRMRETSNGSLPKGHCPVRPQDVMILYVEPEATGSIVREMPLNEQGALVKAWPGGFFEEGLREIF